MVDKSGGDVMQANQGTQASMSAQDLNSVAAAGAGITEGMGGAASSVGAVSGMISQMQTQGNIAATGSGGNDNISADTTGNFV